MEPTLSVQKTQGFSSVNQPLCKAENSAHARYIDKKVAKLAQKSRHFQTKPQQTSLQASDPSREITVASREEVTPRVLNYFSEGERTNFNCQASRRRAQGVELVEYRHLSYAYATGQFGRTTTRFKPIASLGQIAAAGFIPDDEQLNRKFLHGRSSKDALYFSPSTFTETLCQVASELKENDKKNYLLFTASHAMAIRFTLSPEKGLVIFFYDPNDTLRHRKIVVASTEDLKSVSIDDFIPEKEKHLYFPQDQQAGCLLSIRTSTQRDDCRVRSTAQPTESLCQLMLTHGHYGHPDTCAPSDKIQRATMPFSPIGFLETLKHDHLEAFNSYIDNILNCEDLSDSEKAEQLAARATHGTPMLAMALKLLKKDVYKSFFHKVMNSNLSKAMKKEVLHAKNEGGDSWLYTAIHNGGNQAIYDYVRLMSNSTLEDNTKKELLSGMNRYNRAAISSAIVDGKKTTAISYVRAILRSSLSEHIKKDLILEATPALNIALQKGDASTFISLAVELQIADMDDETTQAILAAKDRYGKPGIVAAYDHGKDAAAEAIIRLILDSDLKGKAKVELLSGKDQKGVPWLFTGLERGYSEAAIGGYVKLILNSHLSPEEKRELLIAEHPDGREGLGQALKYHPKLADKAYVQPVQSSKLDSSLKQVLTIQASEKIASPAAKNS
ncbi:MAG: ShET2/EspL2 family type III secretion system effector toxin [Endozoicomonas sp.]|uniref:ShET2/EspL2 family type III secretion system effector toxin n=1 Tax=Endozoicomonas sp. TaxID=1892382 RepID=UPI003D9B4338